MPTLDLTRFHNLDFPLLYENSILLESARSEFAHAVTTCAAQCQNNAELLDSLYRAMPPESGLGFPALIGEGSTRRVYQMPFGMVLKIERTDTVARAVNELDSHLRMRRRIATFGELTTGWALPGLVPQIYGVLLGFGHHPPNPVCVVTERCQPLSELVPADMKGIAHVDLALAADGTLKVFDDRFPSSAREPTDRNLKEALDLQDEGVWTGNIGWDQKGRYVLLDTGNKLYWRIRPDQDYLPVIGNELAWVHCLPLSPQHREQTKQISEALFQSYLERRNSYFGYEQNEQNPVYNL